MTIRYDERRTYKDAGEHTRKQLRKEAGRGRQALYDIRAGMLPGTNQRSAR